MGGLTMVMAPSQLSNTASRKHASIGRPSSRDRSQRPSSSEPLSRPASSIPATRTVSFDSTRFIPSRNGKRKFPTVPSSQPEEDDGFVFRRDPSSNRETKKTKPVLLEQNIPSFSAQEFKVPPLPNRNSSKNQHTSNQTENQTKRSLSSSSTEQELNNLQVKKPNSVRTDGTKRSATIGHTDTSDSDHKVNLLPTTRSRSLELNVPPVEVKKTKKPSIFDTRIGEVPSTPVDETHQRPPVPRSRGNKIKNNTLKNATKRIPSRTEEPSRTRTPSPPGNSVRSEQIALPTADTPIIRKNQQMRKSKSGVRRSSLGNRGKRASSIGNGFEAVPHADVSPKSFYKHIDGEMSEPQRMKQLLLWSLKRVLESQEQAFNQAKVNPAISVEDKTAINVARFIQEEIVKDVEEGKISTSWWSRPENLDLTETIKKPNSQNIRNKENLETFKKRYDDLIKEKAQWEAQLAAVKQTAEQLVSNSESILSQKNPKSFTHVKSSSLDPKMLKRYPNLTIIDEELITPQKVGKMKQDIYSLEKEVDKLDNFTHLAGSVTTTATLFSTKQMSDASKQLTQKSQKTPLPQDSLVSTAVQETKVIPSDDLNVPVRDILRALTRIDNNLQ